MSSKDFVVPFGIRINKDGSRETVFLEDISKTEEDVANNFGRRCGLVCPECGKPLVARRNSVDNKHGFKCFAHESGAGASCEGYGEKSSHKAAEDMLSNGIGQIFYLPEITAFDMIPHTSKYKDSGDKRYTVNEIDSARDKMDEATCGLVNDSMVLQQQIACVIDKVWIENDTKNAPINLPKNKRPDAVVSMYNRNDTNDRYVIAVEFRYKHAKSLNDMMSFYDAGTDVLEILLPELSDMSDDFKRSLHDTIFGVNGADNDSDKYAGKREWLYSSKAETILSSQYTLAIQPYVYVKNDNGYPVNNIWKSSKAKALAIVDSYVRDAFQDSGIVIRKSKYTYIRTYASYDYTFIVPYFPFDSASLYAEIEYTLGVRNDDDVSTISDLKEKAKSCVGKMKANVASDNEKREQFHEKRIQAKRLKQQEEAARQQAVLEEEAKRQAKIGYVKFLVGNY